MKNSLAVLILSLLVSCVYADEAMKPSTSTVRQATAADMAQPEKADIAVTVHGMVCSFCAQGITKKLQELPQVEKVDVRMAESRVYITLRRGEELSDKKIKEVVEYAGYTLGEVRRSPR